MQRPRRCPILHATLREGHGIEPDQHRTPRACHIIDFNHGPGRKTHAFRVRPVSGLVHEPLLPGAVVKMPNRLHPAHMPLLSFSSPAPGTLVNPFFSLTNPLFTQGVSHGGSWAPPCMPAGPPLSRAIRLAAAILRITPMSWPCCSTPFSTTHDRNGADSMAAGGVCPGMG